MKRAQSGTWKGVSVSKGSGGEKDARCKKDLMS